MTLEEATAQGIWQLWKAPWGPYTRFQHNGTIGIALDAPSEATGYPRAAQITISDFPTLAMDSSWMAWTPPGDYATLYEAVIPAAGIAL